MGDLANMTSVHGEVNGFRLLRWLRSRAEMAWQESEGRLDHNDIRGQVLHVGMSQAYREMADDLEAELIPPDYPGGDDDTVNLDDQALKGGPEAP
jgi:hypothetical protein